MISSHVKNNVIFTRESEKYLGEMVWHFIGVYIYEIYFGSSRYLIPKVRKNSTLGLATKG